MCSVSYSRPRWIPSPRRRPRWIPSPQRRPRWIPSPRRGVQQRIRKDLPQTRVLSNTLSQVQHQPSDDVEGELPRAPPPAARSSSAARAGGPAAWRPLRRGPVDGRVAVQPGAISGVPARLEGQQADPSYELLSSAAISSWVLPWRDLGGLTAA